MGKRHGSSRHLYHTRYAAVTLVSSTEGKATRHQLLDRPQISPQANHSHPSNCSLHRASFSSSKRSEVQCCQSEALVGLGWQDLALSRRASDDAGDSISPYGKGFELLLWHECTRSNSCLQRASGAYPGQDQQLCFANCSLRDQGCM